MGAIINPHDRFFKEVLAREEVARDFLEHYLPADVLALLDLSEIELAKDTFVDKELHVHFSDLLYRVRLREGGDALIYVLFEHKSYPEQLIGLHLLRYMVRIWEQEVKQKGRLAPIFPVVVYHGREEWEVGQELHDLLEVPEALKCFVPNYRYWLCDLTAYTDEEIKGEVILRASLLALRHIFSPGLGGKLVDIIGLVRELAERRTGLEYLETLLRYLASAAEAITEEELHQAVEAVFPQEGGRLMATIAEKWVQEGLQQGLQQGVREGLLAGIELGLELKFGSEGLGLLAEIRGIEDVSVLRAIHEGLKRVQTLEELRRIYCDGE